MKNRLFNSILFIGTALLGLVVNVSEISAKDEFTPLFNGKDLNNWVGLPGMTPAEWESWQEMSANKKAAKQKEYNADMKKHWSVENGEIVNDGLGPFLTTNKDYKDFEMTVDWKIVGKYADSGIYLRGTPQVQIWDPKSPKEQKNGCAKGSGALWNNHDEKNGKFPLVKADNPPGEWNTMKIKMVGDRVTVHLNGKMTVDNATMDNYYTQGKTPIVDSGPIQLQTHGGEMRFRNVTIREITSEEKKATQK
jgi:hypothetical protein